MINNMKAAEKILFLYHWPSSSGERILTFVKILLKEAFLHGHWRGLLANRRVGGQVSLPRNVLAGMNRLGIDFVANNFDRQQDFETCFVLKDVRCLNWAIKQKQLGRIRRLVAGPMIANFPSDSGRIIESPLIDTYLLPSEWIKNLFVKLSDSKTVNFQVWPIGVDTDFWQPAQESKRDTLIVFVKNPDPGLLEHVLQTLTQRGLKFIVLHSGKFTQSQYLALLQSAAGVIFLSRTESQGIAMFEAWSCDVPTLHWNPGEMRLLGQKFQNASSCPYLTKQCGLSFADGSQFESTLDQFMDRLSGFKPRSFAVQYSLEKTVSHYLSF
jgi:glycosyltransferase involved in cell wall biosynthesis